MSDYRRCEKCGNYSWSACKCVRFRCGFPFRGSIDRHSLRQTWARDAQAAAEAYAEYADSDGDYSIIKNGSAEVWVLDEDDMQTKWFIEAEAVPTYNASSITTDTSGAEPK